MQHLSSASSSLSRWWPRFWKNISCLRIQIQLLEDTDVTSGSLTRSHILASVGLKSVPGRPVVYLNVVLPPEISEYHGSAIPAEWKQSVGLLNILRTDWRRKVNARCRVRALMNSLNKNAGFVQFSLNQASVLMLSDITKEKYSLCDFWRFRSLLCFLRRWFFVQWAAAYLSVSLLALTWAVCIP